MQQNGYHQDDYGALEQRLGEEYVRRRLQTEAMRAHRIETKERVLPYLANGGWKKLMLQIGLKSVGLYEKGVQNFLDIQVRENVVLIPHLPHAFDGLRLLHLSDLHIDLDTRLTDEVVAKLAPLAYDVTVITGDFRAATSGSSQPAIDETRKVLDALTGPVYGILGNHDFLETVPPLEQAGLQFLVNETVVLQRQGQRLYLSGVDDHHSYMAADIARTAREIPAGAMSILLSHTPDTYRSAARHGYDFMLCGHTHAGQICLPGGRAVQKNVSCPPALMRGSWRFEALQGYTSSGTGATGVPIRFHCPAEITLHTLRCATPD